MSNKYIHECRYNKISDQLCPVFSIKQILEDAEFNSFESLKVLKKVLSLLRLKYFKSLKFYFKKGGVILMEIIWDCNYNYYNILNSKCLPKYEFYRLDNSGFNFR